MRHWWVNQNQTYRHEVQGGYLWSPKRNANGARNPFYESMREVAPGDLIFSFIDTHILAVGIAQSYCWESPKPLDFGTSGQNWENIGWRVKVRFTELVNKVHPKDHIDILRPLLPDRYSPLQANGNGLQSVYLTELPTGLAEVLIGLIGQEVAPIALSAADVMPISADDLDSWERTLEQVVVDDLSIPETDRLAIIRARRGQGLFKGQFVLPHLTVGTCGPAPKLSLHALFNYILKLLDLGCQWKELPIAKDSEGRPEIHYTRVYGAFRRWQAGGCFDLIFSTVVLRLRQTNLLDVTIIHGDGTTTAAKKGATTSASTGISRSRAIRSLPSATGIAMSSRHLSRLPATTMNRRFSATHCRSWHE